MPNYTRRPRVSAAPHLDALQPPAPKGMVTESGVRETKHTTRNSRFSRASIMEPDFCQRMTDSSAVIRGHVDYAKLSANQNTRKKSIECLAERLDCLSEVAGETKFPDVARRAIELIRRHEDKEVVKIRLRSIGMVSRIPEIKRLSREIVEQMETIERLTS
jgi:hypothetical protein